jgi:kumamolisin
VAPGAKIAVYFAPNTDRGFLDAVSAAVHDTNNRPNVISISWGGPESSWTQQSMDAMTQIFREAASIGVPVFVAAGDDGATDGVETGELTVDFPAASPAAIACGGTRLEAANGKRTREVVWNDLASDSGATGGGFSKVYQAPAWQKTSLKDFKQRRMRGVPDVSANADPQTGYRIHVDGKNLIFGGTSAVAPLMAALVALCGQKGGATPRDFVARVYGGGSSTTATKRATTSRGKIKLADFASTGSPAKPIVFDVTEGTIDGFVAKKGWDACTGLGVPVGTRVLKGVYGR